jgi:hypothetical protein
MDQRDKFRYICYNNINLISQLDVPKIEPNKEFEAALVEFRPLPHLEFIFLNAIHKLGERFSHTIICGNLNHDLIVYICRNISGIKIIRLNVDNVTVNDYNNFLHTVDFWNLFQGKKVLLYQEDTIIFKNNISEFLHYDYIGAPWRGSNNLPSVGNGGFSLRNKDLMIESIMKKEVLYNWFGEAFLKECTNSFCNHSSGVKLDNIPEDLFFSKSALILNNRNLPDPNTASEFSTENILNLNSFGGHQFWNCDANWANRMDALINEIKDAIKNAIKDVSTTIVNNQTPINNANPVFENNIINI